MRKEKERCAQEGLLLLRPGGSRAARGRRSRPRPRRASSSQSSLCGASAAAKAQRASQAVPAVERPAAHRGGRGSNNGHRDFAATAR